MTIVLREVFSSLSIQIFEYLERERRQNSYSSYPLRIEQELNESKNIERDRKFSPIEAWKGVCLRLFYSRIPCLGFKLGMIQWQGQAKFCLGSTG